MEKYQILFNSITNFNSCDDWLEKNIKELELGRYSKFKSVFDRSEFNYSKTFYNEEDQKIYQIILKFYDFRKYDTFDSNQKMISVSFTCMLIGGDRYDFTITSDDITVDLFEEIATDFYSSMKKYYKIDNH